MDLQIIHYPHPTLRHVSRPLKKVDAQLRQIVDRMFDLMYEHQGVGLAANQVDLPYRLFVTNPEGDPAIKDAQFVFLNPILQGGRGHAEADEGCLSIPDVYGPVTRHANIILQGFDLKGNEIRMPLEGLFARIAQHETDHLDGTLFIDRLGPAQALQVKDVLQEFELVHRSKQETGELPEDAQIADRLAELERLRT